VSLLLRKPILQEEDMLYTVAAAEAGLIYTDEVSRPAFYRLLSHVVRVVAHLYGPTRSIMYF
jgi:hypothetical protein